MNCSQLAVYRAYHNMYWFCRRSIEFRGISNEHIFINKLTSLIDTAFVSGPEYRKNVYGDLANDGSVNIQILYVFEANSFRIFLQNMARHRLALLVLFRE